MNKFFQFALLLITFFTFSNCTSTNTKNDVEDKQTPLLVFLVRHGEKVDKSKDAELSLEGKERAEELSKVLQSSNIQYIHSSDYIRTRETAQPTADLFGLDLELYDPSNLNDLAIKLKEKGGNHLVVGHSNTTPELTKILGGVPGSPINEESEYDRLYIVSIASNGEVETILTRFGRFFK